MNDPRLFSRYLPYAVALDVADNWARAFEGLFQEAPSWYGVSVSPHRFSPSGFSQSLDRVAAGLTSALVSSPRGGSGGGFGGGGSSGGGFGGGGGGSW